MPHNLTGKDKSARIPLPYHEKVGRRRRKWAIVGGVILLLAAMVVGATGYWKEWSAPLRPVHSAHAAWENDCSSCHAPLKPTNSSNMLAGWLSNHGKASDDLCIKCHEGQNEQQHHANMKEAPETARTCAACHKEHQGRSAFITRVADAKCTCCHSDLSKHSGGTPDYFDKIHSFENGHPQFSLGEKGNRVKLGEAKDPGKLRFNHKMHLTAGIFGEGSKYAWTFERITDKAMRERLMKLQKDATGKEVTPQTLIDLGTDATCSACHVTSASDDGRKTGPVRANGDYVLPVTYDHHCKGCHPLTFSPSDAKVEGAKKLKDVEIPHHLQPDQVRDFLSGVFARNEVKADATDARVKKILAAFPLPGDNVTREKREEALRKLIKDVADEGTKNQLAKVLSREELQKDEAERLTTCGLCHHKEAAAGGKSERIVLPDVPEVWFVHAKFSHRAHRTLDCLECHGGNDGGKSARVSVTETDVLLPPRENCLKCHSTARTKEGKKLGGVRQDCVTCHNYHHGDKPLAGRGAAARGVEKRMSIEKLLPK